MQGAGQNRDVIKHGAVWKQSEFGRALAPDAWASMHACAAMPGGNRRPCTRANAGDHFKKWNQRWMEVRGGPCPPRVIHYHNVQVW